MLFLGSCLFRTSRKKTSFRAINHVIIIYRPRLLGTTAQIAAHCFTQHHTPSPPLRNSSRGYHTRHTAPPSLIAPPVIAHCPRGCCTIHCIAHVTTTIHTIHKSRTQFFALSARTHDSHVRINANKLLMGWEGL